MIQYSKIKEELKSKSLTIFKNTKTVENEDFSLKYLDLHKFYDFYFPHVETEIEEWIESMNKEIEIKNLQKLPEYSFIHYHSKKEFPEDFDEEVGLLLINKERLKQFDIVLEEHIEQTGDFNYDNCYSDSMYEIFGYEVDEEKTKLLDTTEMLESLKNIPICEMCDIVEKWEDIFLEEIINSEKAFLIALGQAAHEILITDKVLLIENE